MAEIIRMPRMSDTMKEGTIASWLVKVGDTVESGDILAEVETDKATMELENYEDGTVLYIGVEAQQTVPIDGVIAIIGEPQENIDELLNSIQKSGEHLDDTAHTTSETEKIAETPTPTETIDVSNIKAEVIRMPKMNDTMKEGVIDNWLVKVGDTVQSGDILAEVETDKATMELENYEDGTVLYIGVEAKQSVPIDGIIAIIGEPNADFETLLKAESQKTNTSVEPKESQSTQESKQVNHSNVTQQKSAKQENVVQKTTNTAHETTSSGRIKVSPLAKKMAKEMGYNLAEIKGTGEHGRIIKRDIENFEPTTQKTASPTTSSVAFPVGQESYTEEPVSQMRKAIARRLSESKFQAPHFYLTMEINMNKAIKARKSMNAVASSKISFNDLVIKAVATSLRKHPGVNAGWQEETIRYNQHIHIGVAVAIPDGLIVPVVRFADQKSLSQIGTEVKDLASRAKNKKLQPQEWEGNTFSISNLGMFGIDEFTAIINPPNSCILAVGAIKETPIIEHGEVSVGNIMKVTLSCDHRVVDGATGASFLQTFKELLEDPVRILI